MQDFYNQNQNRKYPFSATASLTADGGDVVQQGLIVDISLAIDLTYGDRYYIAAITKKNGMCTVVISSVNSRLPIATATIDVDSVFFTYGRSPAVDVQPVFDAAIAGSIVFGERFQELPDCVLTFSNTNNSLLHPRTVFPVAMPAAQHWAVFRSGKVLTGDVVLAQDGDIEIVFEPRTLGNKTVQAVVFRLRGSSNDILAQYSASMQRPESNSCEGGRILTINGVQADCCGRIYLEFRGCAQPTRIINHCGVVLECALAIDEICPKPTDYGAVVDASECSPTASVTGGVSSDSSQNEAPKYRL